jgi:signal transduction histidine kinase
MTENITYLVIIGIGVMLLMVISILFAVIFNQRKKNQHRIALEKLREHQQNQLIEAAIKSEEGERHRIAETLHDEVGAILSSVRLHFLNMKTEHLDEKDKQLLAKSKELLDDGIQKVRTISHNLHSSLLKEFGLNEAIRHFLKKTVQGTLIEVETHLDNNYMIQNPQTDIGIYRIIQELVNNILKHAHTNFIHISSEIKNGLIVLQLRYNGAGLSQEEFEELRYKPDGLGLKNIQNRIILLKGSIHYEKRKNENQITLTIPVNEES